MINILSINWLDRSKKIWLPRSIGTHLLIGVLGGALSGIAIIAILFYRSLERKSIDQIRDTLNAQVQLVNGNLIESQTYAKGLATAILVTHQRSENRSDLDAEFYKQLTFEFFKHRTNLIMGVGAGQDSFQLVPTTKWFYPYFYLDQGVAAAAGVRLPAPNSNIRYMELYRDDNYPIRDYWTKAEIGKKDVWIEPYDWYGINMTTFSTPIIDQQNRWIGAAAVDVNVSALSRQVSKPVTRGAGYFVLLSQRGKILAYPPNPQLLKSNLDYHHIDILKHTWSAMQWKRSGFLRIQGQLLSYQRIPSTQWIAVAIVPESVVTIPIGVTIAISVFIATAVILIVVYWSIRHLKKRLQPILNECHQWIDHDGNLHGASNPNHRKMLKGNAPAPHAIDPITDELIASNLTDPDLTVAESLETKPVSKQALIDDSRQTMDELDFLAFSFDQMSRKVKESMRSLESANAALQQTVAERTEAINQLQEAQVQLVQSEKMSSLGQLLAGIAHEINNPVNFIHANLDHVKSYAQELLDGLNQYRQVVISGAMNGQLEPPLVDEEELLFIQDDLVKILDSMSVGTHRIRQLVLSLRTFSRTDKSTYQSFSIQDGIETTLALLTHRLKASQRHPAVQVIKHYAELPPVECYPGPINQVLMNLLVNAIDALESRTDGWCYDDIEKHPNQIEITTRFLEDEQQIEIVIADNGTGIPEAIREKIFDPFFTTKPVGQGTGIGLSIGYQIITEQHGGTLSCTSTVGEGTQFSVRLPVTHSATNQASS